MSKIQTAYTYGLEQIGRHIYLWVLKKIDSDKSIQSHADKCCINISFGTVIHKLQRSEFLGLELDSQIMHCSSRATVEFIHRFNWEGSAYMSSSCPKLFVNAVRFPLANFTRSWLYIEG